MVFVPKKIRFSYLYTHMKICFARCIMDSPRECPVMFIWVTQIHTG